LESIQDLNRENITIDEGSMTKILNWAYDSALNGIPGLGTAEDLAKDFLKEGLPYEKCVDKLIHWQDAKCATSGFITGLGGFITLPVAIPVNLASVIYVQIRMIAAIAYMGGYDIRDDRVRTLVYVCLVGNSGVEAIKDVGIQVGTKAAKNFIKNKVSAETLKKINQKVGFRLVTKFGEKGVINLGKCVPIVGGVIGAILDGVATQAIGKTAKKTFTPA